jgi:hypothetical protein
MSDPEPEVSKLVFDDEDENTKKNEDYIVEIEEENENQPD